MNGRRSREEDEDAPTSAEVVKEYFRGSKMKLPYKQYSPPGAIVDEIHQFFIHASPSVVNENLLCLWAHYCCDVLHGIIRNNNVHGLITYRSFVVLLYAQAIVESLDAMTYALQARENAENLFQNIKTISYLKECLMEKHPLKEFPLAAFRQYYNHAQDTVPIYKQFASVGDNAQQRKQISWGQKLRNIVEDTRTPMRDILGEII